MLVVSNIQSELGAGRCIVGDRKQKQCGGELPRHLVLDTPNLAYINLPELLGGTSKNITLYKESWGQALWAGGGDRKQKKCGGEFPSHPVLDTPNISLE